MADAVKVVTTIAFTPNGGMPVQQTQGTTYALANAGTLQTGVIRVPAGTPQTVAIPAGMCLFVIDDLSNPQSITFSGPWTGTGATFTQTVAVSATCLFLGPWLPTSTTITTNGTGVTIVRYFAWGK